MTGCWARAAAVLAAVLTVASCASTVTRKAPDRAGERVVTVPAPQVRWAAVGSSGLDRSVLWRTVAGLDGRLERLRPGATWGPTVIGGETVAVMIAGRLQLRNPDGKPGAALIPGKAWRLLGGSTLTGVGDPKATSIVALIPVGKGGPTAPGKVSQPVPMTLIPFRPVPTGDLGLTMLWGDRRRTASIALMQQKAAKAAHVRSYPADTHLIVMKGALTLLPDGRLPGTVLPVGSYAVVPAAVPYVTTTKGQEAQWLQYHPGPVDPLLP